MRGSPSNRDRVPPTHDPAANPNGPYGEPLSRAYLIRGDAVDGRGGVGEDGVPLLLLSLVIEDLYGLAESVESCAIDFLVSAEVILPSRPVCRLVVGW